MVVNGSKYEVLFDEDDPCKIPLNLFLYSDLKFNPKICPLTIKYLVQKLIM